ncbi:hypothetical protein LAZ67_18001957, partial [Cordylochernes scorpioides]
MVACNFREKSGFIDIVKLEDRKTVNIDWCTTKCLPVVFEKINQSRSRAQLRGVLLHHDNARPHTSAQPLDFLANSGIKFDTGDEALQAFINAVNSIPEDDWGFIGLDQVLQDILISDRPLVINVVPNLFNCHVEEISQNYLVYCRECLGEYIPYML